MNALALAVALSAALAGAVPAPPPPDLSVAPPADHGGTTACSACHTEDGWQRVTFAHERTGFALDGRHRDLACRACHRDGDFRKPVPMACSACHRDVHAGRLGQRCARCHDATAWREVAFDADAHRRSAFPLVGRHAVISCEECHGDRRGRAFARPTPACATCHEEDALRGEVVMPGHADLGGDCRGCHGAWRFSPASFPAHEACFSIRSGEHAGIRCADCHRPTVPRIEPAGLSCTSGTADCLRCHSCTKVTDEHSDVSGFQCTAQKCYECHRFSVDD
jgi:hypothetical protein